MKITVESLVAAPHSRAWHAILRHRAVYVEAGSQRA